MSLVRKLVFARLEFNILLKSEHIPGYLNSQLIHCHVVIFRNSGDYAPQQTSTLVTFHPILECLSEEADLIIKCSMASNSWKTYKTAVEAFYSVPFNLQVP